MQVGRLRAPRDDACMAEIYGIDLHKIYIVMRQKALEAAVSVARAETTPPVSHCLARRVEKIRPNAVPFFYFYSSLFWKPSFSQIDYILQKLIPKLSFNADHLDTSAAPMSWTPKVRAI